MTETLKLCPFCGGPARIKGGKFEVWWVECAYDDELVSEFCAAEGSPRRTEKAAAVAWNRRAP